MILVIDNYDSFVHNLARHIRQLGETTEVHRNDAVTLERIEALAPSHIVLSPGPCTPDEAGVSVEVVRRFGPEIPILGVCLGHQCIGQAYGARILRATRPMHGKTSRVRHKGDGVFKDLPQPLRATRYHSLIVSSQSLPPDLEVTAWSEDGEIMALRHRRHAVVGVQFHPEAVLTDRGYDLLRNFLAARPAGAIDRKASDRNAA